jgi:hypothetical protein
MPDIDGIEITQRIRQIVAVKDVKIIIISASAFEETRKECQNAGANDYLTKPFKVNELLDILQKQLNLQWIYEATEPTPTSEADIFHLIPKIPKYVREKIVHYARLGNVKKIANLTKEFGEKEPTVNPLLDEINRLLKQFQFNKIIELLET